MNRALVLLLVTLLLVSAAVHAQGNVVRQRIAGDWIFVSCRHDDVFALTLRERGRAVAGRHRRLVRKLETGMVMFTDAPAETNTASTVWGTLSGDSAVLEVRSALGGGTGAATLRRAGAALLWRLTREPDGTHRLPRVATLRSVAEADSDEGFVPQVARSGEIRFRRGTTSRTVEGAVVRGTSDVYTLGAAAGQRLRGELTALERNAAFTICAPDGTALTGTEEGRDAATWEGELPAAGTYTIFIGPTRGNASYRLTIGIQARRP